MAKKLTHVWGIELGQSGLKALRCHLENDEVVADAFDYIEYPKILSQPESEPEKLIADALGQFTSRNDLRNCKVAISVPGQSGLAKFFKPPPVEVKKIPDIVKYEAKVQIPFDLNDVIWDFQQMGGSNVEDGYALESEVGLFAMKREAVIRALKPFREAGIDLDVIQLAPMSVYGMLAYDRFSERMENETFDPEHPPKSILLLSMGTDSTDLVVTNGFRVWQRSMPIGGNHFTRQLTKDLKLTFTKAEHLKRNAMQADDPKLIFQAMRPVFNDMVTEIQRSIGFFRSLNKKAEIESILLLGNTVKLPGLQPYLNKNLGFDVNAMDKFQRLSGMEITGAPSFKENQLAFGVVYGLCLQLLGKGPMTTNLLPREISTERMIRAKKPWTLVALSALLLGFVANYFFLQRSWANLAESKWSAAEKAAASTKSESDAQKGEDGKRQNTITLLSKIGQEVSSNTDRRILWLELTRIVVGAMRLDPNVDPTQSLDPAKVPYTDRKDFHFTRIDSKFYDDISLWFTEPLQAEYNRQKGSRENLLKLTSTVVDTPGASEGEGDAAAADTTSTDSSEEVVEGNPAWVVQLEGYHYYNGRKGVEKEEHVLMYLIDYLERGVVSLPDQEGNMHEFNMQELGIATPVMVEQNYLPKNRVRNPAYVQALGASGAAGMGMGGMGGPGSGAMGPGSEGGDMGGMGGMYGGTAKEPRDEEGNLIPRDFEAPKHNFVIQFKWNPIPITQRIEKKKEALKAKESEQEKETEAVSTDESVAANP